MKVGDQDYRSIWLGEDGWSVEIIDQTLLPHNFATHRLTSLEQAAEAILSMRVRGAPLIGATAAYGLCLALRQDSSDHAMEQAVSMLLATRPTAVNLRWALERMTVGLSSFPESDRVQKAYEIAGSICDEDAALNESIGSHGLALLKECSVRKKSGKPLNILTHCNAGWLATVDWGTALAPIYKAHDLGMPLHIWVDETRPRNQGASLTAWELAGHGVPHSVIVDNAGGHLMQTGQVDLCITGTDRTAANGDVCNKIGTYLKALAAHDNGIPFYVALPSPTIDWQLQEGVGQIPIEERSPEEVSQISGLDQEGHLCKVNLLPQNSRAVNYGFDVTPAKYVTALITEAGICEASREGLESLFRRQAV
ncbi:S-methyl-5-thioribose-1-phosphate isomerase [Fodinicurvata fenggangensis]|uniref:S-methyl-5-thioribose-1-phosphate isomerase n=1 Tax=Fodinicurvata fenggangensis TaxID=1121830 RepID=UPI0004791679|nr:S-methyl-5-thioribose-1-phosphate isomerase [Fodinicurvata fenggangensis]